MSDPLRIFVNERAISVAAGITVREAVAGNDPELAAALDEAKAYVTDGVGRPIDTATTVYPGAILRVVRSARTGRTA